MATTAPAAASGNTTDDLRFPSRGASCKMTTDITAALSAIQSRIVRSPGNKPLTTRLSQVAGMLIVLQKPEGRPNHHTDIKDALTKVLAELEPLVKKTTP